MRGKVDDFVWVLAIALVLMAAVGIFSYFVPYTGPLTNITVSTFSPGEIGYAQDYVARTINLRTFTVGEEQRELLRAWPQMELSTGILGGNSELAEITVPDYMMETARGVRISFAVYQTNSYGNLIVKWNGREVISQRLSEKEYEFLIEKEHVRGSNTIEAYSAGPGWFFWASSVYIIKNFNVDLEYGPHRIIPFEMLPSEMDKFDRAELTSWAGGTGTLNILVNGVSVFSGSPSGQITESFNIYDAPIKPGQNIVSFIDSTGTYTMRDTVLRIYTTGDRSVATHRFNLTDEHYGFLANSIFDGRINLMIESTARPGSVEVTLNGRQLSAPVPRPGWNSVPFTANAARPGENVLTITGTGSYFIPEAIVQLER